MDSGQRRWKGQRGEGWWRERRAGESLWDAENVFPEGDEIRDEERVQEQRVEEVLGQNSPRGDEVPVAPWGALRSVAAAAVAAVWGSRGLLTVWQEIGDVGDIIQMRHKERNVWSLWRKRVRVTRRRRGSAVVPSILSVMISVILLVVESCVDQVMDTEADDDRVLVLVDGGEGSGGGRDPVVIRHRWLQDDDCLGCHDTAKAQMIDVLWGAEIEAHSAEER
jgi:hypothetical protein